MKPQVSIGVCVRNNADTIREAIESTLAQDFPHELMELIVVAGNSHDETLSVANEKLKNATLTVKIFTESNGLGYARQLVVDNAEGKYIVWVDGDMVISPSFVSKLFRYMEGNPEAGIVKGRQALEPGANLLATLEAYSRVAGKMIDYSSKKAFSKVLGTSGCIYRIEAIRQAGGFDKNLRGYCEDWDAEIRVRAAGWRFSTIDVKYHDYERNRLSWENLWKRYWLRGYYTHYFLQKYPSLIRHYRMFPPAAFVAGFLNALKLFKLTKRKAVYLLPFQHFYKFTAWYVGFLANSLS
jgi:glycosyltransferase involved in cell wall biosynthesis